MTEASLSRPGVPFGDVLIAVEAQGADRGLPQIIKLYTDWIAAQPAGTEELYAAWFNLATEFGQAGAFAEALQSYRNALELRPQFHPAAINLGLLHERLGQSDIALHVWRNALQPDEARIALLNQRARLLEQTGQLADAETILRTSLLTKPDQPDAIQHWVHLRQKTCQWPVLADIVPGLSQHEMMNHSGPLACLALTDDVRVQQTIAADFLTRKTVPVPALAPLEGYRHPRIRIGYVSSDFCSHAMSYLIAELFERHDRSRFEVFGYCASPEDGSPIRARVIAAFDHFVRIASLPDEAAARRIRQDEIDILIDLNGLTAGGRVQMLRWKPAPVQATYLGFIGPVALAELDYLLCDDFVIPPEMAAAYLPCPLPIEGLYQANDSKRVVGAPMTRAQANLPEDRFVFCCFSNHYKITETMFGGWMAILRRTGDSILWMVDDNQWSRQNLRLRALGAGVDPARLIFAGRTDPASYMTRLALADLFLDTFPYNAGTIASDALRMRVPLLTLSGRSFASRMAARMLRAIGAEDGIAWDLDNYIAKATRLANAPEDYSAYRARFTDAAWTQSLGDVAAFTRRFETALLRTMPQVMQPETA